MAGINFDKDVPSSGVIGGPKRVYDKSDARRIVGRKTKASGRNLYFVSSFLFDRS